MSYPVPLAWKRYQESITAFISNETAISTLGVPIVTNNTVIFQGTLLFSTKGTSVNDNGLYSQYDAGLITQYDLPINTIIQYQNIKYQIIKKSIHTNLFMYNVNEAI